MPDTRTTGLAPGDCNHPAEAHTGAAPEPAGPRICFHPGDAWLAPEPAGPRICYHPGDAWLAPTPVSPGHAQISALPTVAIEEPGRPVSPCFHPADASGSHPAGIGFAPAGGDLAAELHRSLTAIDEQALAVLAVR